MVWVGKDHKNHLVPPSCHGQGCVPPAQAAQSPVQPGTQCFQEHPSTRCLSRQPMPVPHCPKQRLLCREQLQPTCQSLAVEFVPRHGMVLKQFLTSPLAAWLCPRQCLPDTARHGGQCPPQHSQAPLGAAPRRKIPTLSRELSATNWSPKSILPAARPLPTT